MKSRFLSPAFLACNPLPALILGVVLVATVVVEGCALAGATTAATMTSPTPGTTLTGTTVTFSWTAGTRVRGYTLAIGSSAGATDVFSANEGTKLSQTVSTLPSDSRTLYVTLKSQANNGRWWTNSYTYTAYSASISTNTPATMTSPVAGSTLNGASVSFTWSTGSGATQYSLSAGSTLGGSNYFSANEGASTSATVNNLPSDGSTVYVRLGSMLSGTWVYNDYTYTAAGTTSTAGCGGISTGPNASLNGFVPFPASNPWNTDISSASVDPNSPAIMSYIGASIGLHPDFGAGEYNGSYMGIPYQVVDSTQAMLNIGGTGGGYWDEGDPSQMPFPNNAAIIEGYPNYAGTDAHALVLQKGNCFLYELYHASVDSSGNWSGEVGVIWDLLNGEQRPYTWTSADAAGLPVFPGLVRYDEVAAGQIKHALRFTLSRTREAFVPPATHWASTNTSTSAPPMGMRVRLKASFDVSEFSAANQVILNAMKKYGMILADNGSSMYVSGTPDDRWNNSDLHQLSGVTASNFEVVQMGTIYTPSNVPSGSAPSISSLSASAGTVAAGTPVTLTWNVTGASYLFISPQAGGVRGNSVTVTPTQTTTYMLYANNQYGRTTATVTVNVQ